ncbi:MAG TPA: hypothetical protein VFE24_12660 [Pirellulales bacterium]|jgi:hypothetical protein|nr:hypothetical protein [Pirellulales bacterium]
MHSFTYGLRALFVVGCLVIVPLLAVFGTSLPATLIAAVAGQETAHAGSAPTPATPAKPLEAAPLAGAVETPKFPQAAPLVAGSSQASSAAKLPDQGDNFSHPAVTPSAQDLAGSNLSLHSTPSPAPATRLAAAAPRPMERQQFSGLESRLQQLGAKYYRLETSGLQGELFHFECQCPMKGNPAPPKVFEATDSDPMQAVARVVHQVEDWRAGGWQ